MSVELCVRVGELAELALDTGEEGTGVVGIVGEEGVAEAAERTLLTLFLRSVLIGGRWGLPVGPDCFDWPDCFDCWDEALCRSLARRFGVDPAKAAAANPPPVSGGSGGRGAVGG